MNFWTTLSIRSFVIKKRNRKYATTTKKLFTCRSGRGVILTHFHNEILRFKFILFFVVIVPPTKNSHHQLKLAHQSFHIFVISDKYLCYEKTEQFYSSDTIYLLRTDFMFHNKIQKLMFNIMQRYTESHHLVTMELLPYKNYASTKTFYGQFVFLLLLHQYLFYLLTVHNV